MSEVKADLAALRSAGSSLGSIAGDLEPIIQAVESAIREAEGAIQHSDLKHALESYLSVARGAHRELHAGVLDLSAFVHTTADDVHLADSTFVADLAGGGH